MKAQRKAQSACDIAVYSDKGSLALRFPKRHSPLWELMDGKSLKGKPKCLGIGKYGYADTPEDWKRATQLAIALEADLDHPEWEKLFDPTLAKYGLGGGKYAKLADVLQMPGVAQQEPEITVGEMWEAYLEWKQTVVEETTFKDTYAGTLTNLVKGKIWNRKLSIHESIDGSLILFNQALFEVKPIAECLNLLRGSKKPLLVAALSQAFDYCKARGIVKHSTQNPFVDSDKYSIPAVTTQDKYAPKMVHGELKQWHEIEDEKALELDRRAFNKEERDIIIKAFYDAKPTYAFYAPLIEFYFLTGCRTSEAIALTWGDIDFERRIIRFSKSLGASTRKIKETKTGEVRLFYFHSDSQLERLVLDLRLKQETKQACSLVFPNPRKKHILRASLHQAWNSCVGKKKMKDGTEKEYYYPGVVRQLVDEGKISGYLPQYHTRHTYITLTAHANKHDNNALLYIASACGNNVDVILRHYLGVTENTQIVEA